MTGSKTIVELLKYNPHIHKLVYHEYWHVFDEIYDMQKLKHDESYYLLYWSKEGLPNWEAGILRSFVRQCGFDDDLLKLANPKIYRDVNDESIVHDLIKSKGLSFDKLVVCGFDEPMNWAKKYVEDWCKINKLDLLNANLKFANENGLNFRQIGAIAAMSLFAVGQEGGWLHVAACSGAKTVGIPRRINPVAAMPEYYHNQHRDRKSRHITIYPSSEFQCDNFASHSNQRPCNFIEGTSQSIVHKGNESCPLSVYKCEDKINRDDFYEGLNEAMKDVFLPLLTT